MHQNLHPGGSFISKYISVVRHRLPEVPNHSSQGSIWTSPHINRFKH